MRSICRELASSSRVWRLLLRAALGSLSIAYASTVVAQFPSRPVTLVVPETPGGANDVLGRTIGQKLQEQWGQPVLLEFHPGAGGILAMQTVLRNPPDGHTIGLVTAAHAINPSLIKNLPYDTVKDFAPVARLGHNAIGLVVMPSLGVNDVKGLIALAKRSPGGLLYGTNGIGNVSHLAAELFKSMAGIDMVHVPYKGGAPLYNEMLGGRISISFAILNSAMPYVKTGKMKVLGVTSLKRSAIYPEFPPISDTLPGYDITTWTGLIVSSPTPKPLVQKIAADALAAMQSADVRRRLADLGYEPAPLGPEEFEAFIRTEIESKGKIVRASDAKLQ